MSDPDPAIIAVFENDGRLPCEPDTSRCSGENDRTRFESGGLGEERDGLADVKDLVFGVAVLERLAVKRACEREHLWVWDSFGRDEARTNGVGVVKALGKAPL